MNNYEKLIELYTLCSPQEQVKFHAYVNGGKIIEFESNGFKQVLLIDRFEIVQSYIHNKENTRYKKTIHDRVEHKDSNFLITKIEEVNEAGFIRQYCTLNKIIQLISSKEV